MFSKPTKLFANVDQTQQ